MRGSDLGICGWQKNSFIDFPGAVSTVLFFAGCNMRCPWCHNPDIVNGILPPVPFDDILKYVEKRKGIIDGVVLSGGEPTIHRSLLFVIKIIREKSLKIKIDTNGLNPGMILLCKPDYLALDIKTLPAYYSQLGCSIPESEDLLFRSIDIVRKMGKNAEIRITMAPGFIDDNIIDGIAAIIQGVSNVYLQQFNNRTNLLDGEFSGKTPISVERVRAYREMIAPFVGKCVIRGEEC